jgi:lipopolysaccharide biosynthesis glycosyltransferase
MTQGTIVCGCDENYAMPLTVMLQSLADCLPKGTRQAVLVLDGGMLPRSLERLLTSTRDTSLAIKVVQPDMARLANLAQPLWFTRANYLRLLIPELVGPNVSKVLYLDCDLLVLQDISPLWDIELGDAPLAAVQDMVIPVVSATAGLRNWETLHHDPDAMYLNSGVLLFNVARWRRDRLSDVMLEYAGRHGDLLRYADQDVLNAVLCGQWLPLPPTWNIFAPWYFNGGAMPKNFGFGNPVPLIPRAKPAIIHFAGLQKPWHWRVDRRQQQMFMRFRQKTAWASIRAKLWSRRPARVDAWIAR